MSPALGAESPKYLVPRAVSDSARNAWAAEHGCTIDNSPLKLTAFTTENKKRRGPDIRKSCMRVPLTPNLRACGIEASWYMLLTVEAGRRSFERDSANSQPDADVTRALRMTDLEEMQPLFNAMYNAIFKHDDVFPQKGNPEAMSTWHAVARHTDQVRFTTSRLTWCPVHHQTARYDQPVCRSYVPLDNYRQDHCMFHEKDVSCPYNAFVEFFEEYTTALPCGIEGCTTPKVARECLLDRLGMHVMIECTGTGEHKDILRTVSDIKDKTFRLQTVAGNEVEITTGDVRSMMVTPVTTHNDQGHFQALIWPAGSGKPAVIKDSNSVYGLDIFRESQLMERKDRIAGVLVAVVHND